MEGQKDITAVEERQWKADGMILGFPDYFLKATLEAAEQSDTLVSFRTGQPPHFRKGVRVSPKPASLKTKTCLSRQGIEMIAGFVPVDQKIFARAGCPPDSALNALESVCQELRAHDQEEEAKKFSAVPLKVTFDEISSGSRLGHYSLFRVRGYKSLWEFTAPKASNQEFSLIEPDRCLLRFRIKKSNSENDESLLEVEYAVPNDTRFLSLTLVAYEGCPVTGDADMLAVASPLQAAILLGEELLQGFSSKDLYRAYDVSDFSQLKELVVLYLLLRHAMNGKPVSRNKLGENEINVIMQSAAVRASGVITPYELLVLMLCHEKLSSCYEKTAPGSENLIRHGAETCNRGRLANLDVPTIHVWQGKIFVTQNEKELVNFYLQPGLLEKNFLYVNPRWNMERWSPVIERQLALGQENLIAAETLRQFQLWRTAHAHEVSGVPLHGETTHRIVERMGSVLSVIHHPVIPNQKPDMPSVDEIKSFDLTKEKNDAIMPVEPPIHGRPKRG